MPSRQNVEFTTLDGLTLRGWLFPAPERGPAIIMTPGVRTDALCTLASAIFTIVIVQ